MNHEKPKSKNKKIASGLLATAALLGTYKLVDQPSPAALKAGDIKAGAPAAHAEGDNLVLRKGVAIRSSAKVTRNDAGEVTDDNVIKHIDETTLFVHPVDSGDGVVTVRVPGEEGYGYVFTDVVDQTNSAGKNFGEWVSSDESDGTVSALESASVTVDTASGKLEARDIALGEPSMLDPQQVEQLVLQQNMRDAAQNQISGS